MKVKKIYFLAASALTLFINSCGSTDYEMDMSGFTDALVQSFTLQDDKDVAANLSDVFFTINQYGQVLDPANPYQSLTEDALVGQIFNADSLPVGTVIDSLRFDLTLSTVKSVKVYTSTDTTDYDAATYYNFEEPILLEVLSGDGVNTKFYEIKANVHQQVGDSIHWVESSTDLLSGVAGDVTAQRTVPFGDQLYYYLETSTGVLLYTASQTDLSTWTASSLSLPADFSVSSILVYDGAFYGVLANTGGLLTSTDGVTWSVTSTSGLTSLIGAYDGLDGTSELIAIQEQGGKSVFVYSTDGTTWRTGEEIPANFPVSGQSNAQQYVAGTTQRLAFVGGLLADGTKTSSFWNYERTALPGQTPQDVWQEFTNSLDGFTGASLVSYTDTRAAVELASDPNEFWMIFIGEDESNTPDRQIYLTPNRGVGVALAPAMYQLPDSFESRMDMNVFVDDQLRINILGGFNSNDVWVNELWSGRLNKLAFKPLQ